MDIQEFSISGKSTKNSETVTAVGNSWIVCRSKSHPDCVYYFNTFSGEAVWNLSNAEIEKAKLRTRDLQQKNEIINCPEPKQQPPTSAIKIMENTSEKDIRSLNVYKPMNNTQCANIPINNFTPYVGSQIMQTFNNVATIDTRTGEPVVPSYDSNLWSLPSRQQVFITPSFTAVNNQSYAMPNAAYNSTNNISVESFMPLSRRFHLLNTEENKNYPYRKRYNSRYNGYHKWGSGSYNRNNNLRDNDLRKYLAAKKDFNSMNFENNELKKEQDTSDENINDDELCPSDKDDAWLDENINVFDGKLDLTSLKKLITPDTNADPWYFVTDAEVLLNHLKFLKQIINSDQTCQLRVPQYIVDNLNELSYFENNKTKNRARSALRYLSEKKCLNDGVFHKEYDLFNNCLLLVKQNRFVVLLSNAKCLKKFHNNVVIPIYSVDELKNFLSVTKESVNNQFMCSEQSIKYIPTAPRTMINKIYSKSVTKPICMEKDVQTENFSIKQTTDIGVQTDECLNTEKPMTIPLDKDIEVQNTLTISKNEQLNSVQSNVKKEIRLRRFISEQSVNNRNETLDTTKKQFKWRRKRNISEIDSVNSKVQDKNTDKSAQIDEVKEISNSHLKDIDNSPVKESDVNPLKESNVNLLKESDDNPLNESDASSISVHKTVKGNVIIEESSTSGVISHTTSDAESDSLHSSYKDKNNALLSFDVDKKGTKLFKITDLNMEKNIEIRCEECISRFVQIMEEALTQILQQEPTFTDLPPPWTIHEATECVKRKFFTSSVVFLAANNLSSLLFQISGDTGKLNASITPNQFIKMFSYGYHLIEALLKVTPCEDLHIAMQALSKLLNDTRDPYLDTSDNLLVDAFSVCNSEVSLNLTISTTENENVRENRIDSENRLGMFFSSIENTTPTKVINSKNYNLRSGRKKIKSKQVNDGTSSDNSPVKIIRTCNIEDTFFTSLRLQKKPVQSESLDAGTSDPNSNTTLQISIENNKNDNPSPTFKCPSVPLLRNINTAKNKVPKVDDNKHINDASLDISMKSFPINNDITENIDTSKAVNKTQSNGPTIIRNFTKCMEYEKRLQTRDEKLDLDDLDYENFDDELSDDDVKDDYYSDSEEYLSNYNFQNEPNIDPDADVNNNFQWFIGKLVAEIKESFVQVQSFCLHMQKTIVEGKLTKSYDILDKVEKTYTYVDCICKSLSSIKDRETRQSDVGLQELLNRIGIDSEYLFELDDKELAEYIEIVGACMSQGHVLRESLEVILEMVNES